jgi:hypothetical protein
MRPSVTRLSTAEIDAAIWAVPDTAPSVTVIDGTMDGWVAAGPDAEMLRIAPVLTIGLCKNVNLPPGAGPPTALQACDLRVLVGSTSSAHGWNRASRDDAEIARWLEHILAGVERAPSATLATARLLRLTEDIAPLDGLVFEAFAYSVLQAGPEFAAWLKGRAKR